MSLKLLCYMVLFFILFAISIIDIRIRKIPNGFIMALAIVGGILAVYDPYISFFERSIGFFSVSLFMYGCCFFVKHGFGGGDIKLMAVGGFILGYEKIVWAMYIACFFGGFYGIYLWKIKKLNRKVEISFGPFLCMGISIAVVCEIYSTF